MKVRSYWEIIWEQFKKNRFAYYSCYIIFVFYLLAIFAPVIADSMPFYFYDNESDSYLYPWVVSLFHPDNTIDLLFNMLLLSSPLLLWMMVYSLLKKRVNLLTKGLIIHFVLGIVMTFTFSFSAFAPPDKYFSRDFKHEIITNKGEGKYMFPLIPLSPIEQDLEKTFKPPLYSSKEEGKSGYFDTITHLCGTDGQGRDVFIRLIYGTRVALTIGILAVAVSTFIGVVVGAIAGFFGGNIDIVLSRIIEVVMLFPRLFLIIVIVAMLGASGDRLFIVMLVIGLVQWPGIARLVRGEFLKQRAMDYVEAARALGISKFKIIFRHVLPNAISPVFVSVPFTVAWAVVLEVSLTFLQYGVTPPTPSWGEILRQAFEHYSFWWLALFSGLCTFVLVTAFNLIGAGVRDAVDPRLRT